MTIQTEIDDFIKDFGLEISGGDFTQEHFYKYQAKLNALLVRAQKQSKLEGQILQIQMMDGIATDNIEMWLKNCLANLKAELSAHSEGRGEQ